jgi:CHAD domain-containing protein
LRAALRAALGSELEAARAVVAESDQDSAERVHSARKHLKRWRALERLLPQKTRAKLQRETHTVRLVSRSLGKVRDPVAQAESWAELTSGRECSDGAPGVTQLLDARIAQRADPSRVQRRLRRAAQLLARAAARSTELLASGVEDEDRAVGALLRGLARSYRKARKQLQRALAYPNTEQLHALRRATKAHQYQLQFLELIWQKPLKAQRKQAQRVTDKLGTERDLSAITRLLRADADVHPYAWFGLLQRLKQKRARLSEQAFDTARFVFAERPRAFRARILSYVRASGQTQPALTAE